MAWDTDSVMLVPVTVEGRVKSRQLACLAAKKKSAAVAVAVYTSGDEHVLDNLDDALLLPPGQFGSVIEDLSEFAGRAAAAWLGCVTANEKVGADFE